MPNYEIIIHHFRMFFPFVGQLLIMNKHVIVPRMFYKGAGLKLRKIEVKSVFVVPARGAPHILCL